MAPAGNRVIAGLVLVLILIALTIATGDTTTQRSTASRTGLIVGRVVDAATGRPVGGAIVTLQGTSTAAAARRPSDVALAQSDASAQPRILTGTDGYFVFRDLPAGAFTVAAVKTGYAEGASGRRRPGGPSQALTLEAGQRVGDVVVRVWQHGSLTGSVVDEIGEPVVGMPVRAYRRSAAGGSRRFIPTGSARTDDRGVYRIAGQVPGEYIVCACARQSSMPMDAALLRRGGAVDPALDGALSLGGPYPMQVGDTTVAVAPGPAFALVGNRLMTYPPVFRPEGIPSGEAHTITLVSGEERTGIDLQIAAAPGVRVSGTLSSPDGVVNGVSMRLVHESFEHTALEQESPTTLTDGNGRFTFPSVPAGRYMLRVIRRASGYDLPLETGSVFWTNMLLVIGRTDVDGVAVVLQDGLRITGQFAFEGASDRASVRLSQVPVILEPADATSGDPAMLLGPNPVDPAGHFRTVGLPAGRYFLRVSGSPAGWMFKAAMLNGVDVSETPLELHDHVEGVVISFTDRWTGFRGTVRRAKNQPDDSASVLLFPSDPERWSHQGAAARRTRSVRTSTFGEYNFTSLPAGDYYVVAVPDEDAADWRDPASLEQLARTATRLTIAEGDQKVVDLRTREAR